MKNKTKIMKRICIIAIIVSVLTPIAIFAYSMIYDYQCRRRVYEDMEESLTPNVIMSNIRIVTHYVEESNSTRSSAYGHIASGVIFRREGDTYYALTACHVINKTPEDSKVHVEEEIVNSYVEYIVMPYGTPTYAEVKRKSVVHVTAEEVYEKYTKATLEYCDESKDLAIISFTSEEELGSVAISDAKIEEGERIAVIGNADSESFVTTYGKISSDELKSFQPDEQTANMVLHHNAYIAAGSSGCVSLNEDMEIIGINIGGGTDVFGRFRYGAMIPNDQIAEVINNWEETKEKN